MSIAEAPQVSMLKNLPTILWDMKENHLADLIEALTAWVRIILGEAPLPLPPPRIVEIHPAGKGLCPFKCKWCTGKNLRHKGLRRTPLRAILDVIRKARQNGVRFITLSGIYSEPLTHKKIHEIMCHLRKSGVAFGLHSKFYLATPPVIDALTSAPNAKYCAVSFDYFNEGHYAAALGTSERAWAISKGNIEALVKTAHDRSSSLEISIRTLIAPPNSVSQLSGMADWMRDLRARHPRAKLNWRLSFPWTSTPKPGETAADFDPSIHFPAAEKKDIAEWIDQILQVSADWPGRGNVSFRKNEGALRTTEKRACFYSLLFTALGVSGRAYACQGCATPEYDHLSYCDLTPDGHDFYDAFRSRPRSAICAPAASHKCPGCAAPTEAAVNSAAANLAYELLGVDVREDCVKTRFD